MRGAIIALAMLLLQGNYERTREVDASPERFEYQRVVQTPAIAHGQACAVLDAAVYAHAAGRLNSLRIYSNGHEVPFALTESGEAGQQEESARVMNLGRKGMAIVFDLAMPQRPYTEVVLDLNGQDFYAVAKVSGAQSIDAPRTELGKFVLFDLRTRGLSRSTVLSLQETSFPLLHVEMTVSSAPGGEAKTLGPEMVHGASVPPSREAQMLFTTVAQTNDIVTKGRESLATLSVPAHVPVERVTFVPQITFEKNFSREVRITAHSSQTQDSAAAETLTGEIERVRLPVDVFGEGINSQRLSIEALIAANLRSDATVEVAVENGDDAPLPLREVQLQMRQRKVCFETDFRSTYILRYGAPAPVRAPVYDYARLFHARASDGAATLGPETLNPDFRGDTGQSYKDRHPEFLWVALLLVIAVLGTIALHNARRVGRRK